MNISAIDLNLLKVFEALYAERNVTRAGERIGLAQSSMSNALKRLRHVFGDELFRRTPAAMQPTPLAEQLAPRIHAVLIEVAEMVGESVAFDPATARGSVRLATSDNIKILLAPRLVGIVARDAPGVRLRMRALDKDRIASEFDVGAVDIAVGTFDEVPSRLSATTLYHDSLVCLVHPDHTRRRRTLSLDEFVAMPHALVTLRDDATGQIDELLRGSGRARQVGATVDQFSVLPHIVAETGYVALCPRSIAGMLSASGLCVVREAPIELPRWPVQAVVSRAARPQPLVEWTLARIRTILSGQAEPSRRSRPRGHHDDSTAE